MKNIFKLILVVIVIVGLMLIGWTVYSDYNQNDNLTSMSDDALTREFSKLSTKIRKTNGSEAEIVSYEVETVEDSRRLKIVYRTDFEELDERELLDESSAIFDQITSYEIMSNYLDRVWVLGLNDNKYVLNRSLTVIDKTDSYMIRIIFAVLIAFASIITLFFRFLYYNRKRNKNLGGEDIYDYSLEDLLKYVEKSKYDDEAFKQIAVLLTNSGKSKEAKSYIEKAIGLNPRNLTHKRIAGKIFYNAGDYSGSIKYFKGSQELQTINKDYDYYYHIGRAYMKNGDDKKGVSSIEKAKSIITKTYESNPAKQKMMLDEIEKFIKSI